MPASPVKTALEDLLRARRLEPEAPPLRGEQPRSRPLPTGLAEVDAATGGGLPRGQLSQVHGPASSGRSGLLLSLVARATAAGALAAWVDPQDRLDPESAASCGADLTRLLWLRGGGLLGALKATGTLLDSGLFEAVILDLAGAPARETRRLPGPTWIRLQRAVAQTPTALVLLAASHVACGPGGASLALRQARARWSGAPGPGHLLRGIDSEAVAGRHALRRAGFGLETAY